MGGSWDLTISCKGTAAGLPSKRKETLFLPIQEAAGGDLQAGAGDTGGLVGYVLYDSAKPERACSGFVAPQNANCPAAYQYQPAALLLHRSWLSPL